MFLKLNVVEILTSQLMWSPVAEPVIVLSKTRYFIFINVFGNEQGKFCSRRHHLPDSA